MLISILDDGVLLIRFQSNKGRLRHEICGIGSFMSGMPDMIL